VALLDNSSLDQEESYYFWNNKHKVYHKEGTITWQSQASHWTSIKIRILRIEYIYIYIYIYINHLQVRSLQILVLYWEERIEVPYSVNFHTEYLWYHDDMQSINNNTHEDWNIKRGGGVIVIWVVIITTLNWRVMWFQEPNTTKEMDEKD